MTSRSLIAIANARGPSAPKTNVARSTLEVTPERDALISNLYGLYVGHVKNEIDRLMREEKYSLTWAANNAIMLVPFGFTNSQDALLPNELRERMKTLPVYIVEKNGRRTNVAFNELLQEETFWTVDCQLIQSAEGLVKESKADSTVASIVNALGDKAQQLPSGTILYNMDISMLLRDSVQREFEPLQVIASESLRRADIEWGPRAPDKWIRVDEIIKRKDQRARNQFDERMMRYLDDLSMRSDGPRQRRPNLAGPLWLASPEVPFRGNEGYCGISSYYRTFLRGDLSITRFLRELALNSDDDDEWKRLCVFSAVFSSVTDFRLDRANIASARLRRISADLGEEFAQGSDQFLNALNNSPLGLFDTSVWSQRDNDWL